MKRHDWIIVGILTVIIGTGIYDMVTPCKVSHMQVSAMERMVGGISTPSGNLHFGDIKICDEHY